MKTRKNEIKKNETKDRRKINEGAVCILVARYLQAR
jgi:hypothetical protein